MWAKSHPEIRAVVKLWYRDKEIPKEELEIGHTKPVSLRQDCPTDSDRTGEVTATNSVFPLGQNCLTTNTETYKETNKKTKAVALPLPAGGQTSQLLEDRKAGMVVQIEQLKRNFGSDRRRRTPELTPAEFEQRRQEGIRMLLTGQPKQTGVMTDG